MMEGDKEKTKENEDFQKKRENFTMAIRKSTREDIFAKKRNLPTSTENSLEPDRVDNYVVDSRFNDYVIKFHKTRFYLETLPELVKAIYDPDIIKQHYGIIGIRKIMSVAD